MGEAKNRGISAAKKTEPMIVDTLGGRMHVSSGTDTYLHVLSLMRMKLQGHG